MFKLNQVDSGLAWNSLLCVCYNLGFLYNSLCGGGGGIASRQQEEVLKGKASPKGWCDLD